MDKICSTFGEIDSSIVEKDKNDKNTDKYYAFVSFKEKEAAEKCLKELNDSNPFSITEKLYVTWHETR